nr:unnamed protein product [Digitaria exilis]
MASRAEKTIDPYPCECPQENEIRLQMYLHQFPAWANVTNPNEYGFHLRAGQTATS